MPVAPTLTAHASPRVCTEPLRVPVKSMPSYSNVLLCFLCFVMRSVHSPPAQYVQPVPEDVRRLAHALADALHGDCSHDPARAVPTLHALLFALFARDDAEGGDCQSFADPTTRALALFGIHPSGSRWQDPSLVTPVVAKLKWAVRVVVFAEVVIRAGDGTVSTDALE